MCSISVVGLGTMASALAGRALAGGNAVEIIGRDPVKAREWPPRGAHVVKAFNTLFSHVLAADPAEGRPLDVFIAGDDAQAKARVSAFIESLGLRPTVTGQLPVARALENVALLQLGLVAHSVKHTNFFLGVSILS
jgi:predicted dinucleotide-binding enzyme